MVLDDIRAREEVIQVDVADRLGLRQDQKVVVALLVMRVILEALDAEILLGEFLVLNGGAHGAVQHQNALGRRRAQGFGGLSNHRRGGP